jgi:uncharacterized protein YjiS (DUF1127 family)
MEIFPMTTQSHSFTPSLIDPAPTAPRPAATIVRLIAPIPRLVRDRLHVWKMRFDDRAYLAGLQDFEVHEMGLTLDQRNSEVSKPFWEA